jgi:hypothetical protein
LQDIRTIAENDLVWGLHNFVQSAYTNEQNKSQPDLAEREMPSWYA